MGWRFWARRSSPEPEPETPAVEPTSEPEHRSEPAFAPPAHEPELPAKLSLTLDEAKAAIRGAKGDVIQVGFLAGEYKRQQEDDPMSAETRAAPAQLCDLIATRLRDRKLLAPDGTFELREGA
jgi:hypothetical protein